MRDERAFRLAEDPKGHRLDPEVVKVLRGKSGMERLRTATVAD